MRDSTILEKSRLDGPAPGLGCLSCQALSQCGGFTRVGGGWSCHSVCRDCDPETCDIVCLKNAGFGSDLREVGGFDFADIALLHQSQEVEVLPQYIPLIYHASGRDQPLDAPWVAVPLHALFRKGKKGELRPRFRSKLEMCLVLGIASTARIVVSGIAKDQEIERYWRWRNDRMLIEAMARLDVYFAITPNYSMILNHPRTQHMFNRKRILICAEEWSAKRVSSVPVLQAVHKDDYRYWLDFLRMHEEVFVVSQEFQTGLAKPERGQRALEQFARLQEQLKRPFHFVAVAGFQYRDLLQSFFDSWTVVDSTPFMKSVHRQRGKSTERGIRWSTDGTTSKDLLLRDNLETYRREFATPPRKDLIEKTRKGALPVLPAGQLEIPYSYSSAPS